MLSACNSDRILLDFFSFAVFALTSQRDTEHQFLGSARIARDWAMAAGEVDVVDFSGAPIGPLGLQLLVRVGFLPTQHITVFSLGRCQLGQLGAVALAGFPAPPTLYTLVLVGNGLDEGCIGVIAPQLPASLRQLNLADNQVGDGGAVVLASTIVPQLTELILDNHGVGPVGARAILERIATKARLHVFNNRLTQKDVDELRDDYNDIAINDEE
jgi:Leucine Rich repeat